MVPKLPMTLSVLCLHPVMHTQSNIAQCPRRERDVIVHYEPPRSTHIGCNNSIPPTRAAGIDRLANHTHLWTLLLQRCNGICHALIISIMNNHQRIDREIDRTYATEQVTGMEDGGDAKHGDGWRIARARARGCGRHLAEERLRAAAAAAAAAAPAARQRRTTSRHTQHSSQTGFFQHRTLHTSLYMYT